MAAGTGEPDEGPLGPSSPPPGPVTLPARNQCLPAGRHPVGKPGLPATLARSQREAEAASCWTPARAGLPLGPRGQRLPCPRALWLMSLCSQPLPAPLLLAGKWRSLGHPCGCSNGHRRASGPRAPPRWAWGGRTQGEAVPAVPPGGVGRAGSAGTYLVLSLPVQGLF